MSAHICAQILNELASFTSFPFPSLFSLFIGSVPTYGFMQASLPRTKTYLPYIFPTQACPLLDFDCEGAVQKPIEY
jgi:hypothetical protein